MIWPFWKEQRRQIEGVDKPPRVRLIAEEETCIMMHDIMPIQIVNAVKEQQQLYFGRIVKLGTILPQGADVTNTLIRH